MKFPIEAHGLNQSLPIYVSRKTATGDTAEYSLTLWMTLLAILLVWTNIILWSAYGLWVVGGLIFA